MLLAAVIIGYVICFLGILFYRDMYIIPRDYKKWCNKFDAETKDIWKLM